MNSIKVYVYRPSGSELRNCGKLPPLTGALGKPHAVPVTRTITHKNQSWPLKKKNAGVNKRAREGDCGLDAQNGVKEGRLSWCMYNMLRYFDRRGIPEHCESQGYVWFKHCTYEAAQSCDCQYDGWVVEVIRYLTEPRHFIIFGRACS
jgi:hypothetical protein